MVSLLVDFPEKEIETLDTKAPATFGDRLASLRTSRGLTQTQLGNAIGVSKRVVAYYETDGGQPPGAMLPQLAQALSVTIDELLAVKPIRKIESPKIARLMNRLRKVADLSPTDQRAVLKYIDSLHRENQQIKRSRRTKTK